MKHLAVLGSTGSIGRQTLEVVAAMPERFKVLALACGSQIAVLEEQIKVFSPELVSVEREEDAIFLQKRVRELGLTTQVLFGEDGNCACGTLTGVDMVVAAMVGVRGLKPVLAAIEAGKNIALANKETLVAAGGLVLPKVEQAKVKLFPVDSEHSAIWQCLWGQPNGSLEHIYLTASGGPFRGFSKEQLEHVSVAEALAHPTWQMGGKITIDSATMMNKGLEVIEASWLFGLPVDDISVAVHPQSIIHSMIRLRDGSVLAQMGFPDMKVPIQVALCYPFRFESNTRTFDPFAEGAANLSFSPCDTKVFRCLDLAYEAGRIGGTLPAVMNSANESAVEAFLNNRISFAQIPTMIERCMDSHVQSGLIKTYRLEDIEELDIWARRFMEESITRG